MARPENTKVRQAVTKLAKVTSSDGAFNLAVRQMREITGLDFVFRRSAEASLPPSGGAKNWGWGDHVDAIDYPGGGALSDGDWRTESAKSRSFARSYAAAQRCVANFADRLARHLLRDREVIVGALFTDYTGTEFELWIDYLVAHASPVQSFWINAEEYEGLPASFHFRIQPDTEYVAISGLNELALDDLNQELKRRLEERREQEKSAEAAILAGNPFARQLPTGLKPPPKEKRGGLTGVVRGGRSTGFDWKFDELVGLTDVDIKRHKVEWVRAELNTRGGLSEKEARTGALRSFARRLSNARTRAAKIAKKPH